VIRRRAHGTDRPAIDGYLAKAGTDKTKLLRATIWLSDIRTVDDMDKVWDAWVPAGCAPARACIEALLQGPEMKVEIRHHPVRTAVEVR
jgi:enamine deaminase RidA (YjgF/YER057c/UK114 family)